MLLNTNTDVNVNLQLSPIPTTESLRLVLTEISFKLIKRGVLGTTSYSEGRTVVVGDLEVAAVLSGVGGIWSDGCETGDGEGFWVVAEFTLACCEGH